MEEFVHVTVGLKAGAHLQTPRVSRGDGVLGDRWKLPYVVCLKTLSRCLNGIDGRFTGTEEREEETAQRQFDLDFDSQYLHP